MSSARNSQQRDVKLVSPKHIREQFQKEGIADRIARGELVPSIMKERHPSAPRAPVPFCTRSQILAYRSRKRELVAVVHRYLKPDGTIGASGKEDPKLLRLADGRILRV